MWFIIILILICALCVIFITPSVFETPKDTRTGHRKNEPRSNKPKYTPTQTSNKWDGPKTDARINRMLAECIILLKNLNVPISNSICPTVKLIGSRRTLGRCCAKGSRKKYTEYDFYIEMSGHILQNTEKSLRSVLIHELLHTMPEGYDHRGEWKKWAKYVSEKTGYNIKRCEGDETEEDLARFFGTYVENQSK